MDSVFLLAQDSGRPAVWERCFRDYPPAIAIPVFLVALVIVAILVERVVLALVRRAVAKTVSKIDDAFVEGLPGVFRPLFVLVGIHVVVHQLLQQETAGGGTELTS